MDKTPLTKLAKALRSRVREQQYFNRQAGESAHIETKGKFRGYRAKANAGDNHVELTLQGFDGELCFSVNRPDLIFSMDTPTELPGDLCKLTAYTDTFSGAAIRQWFEDSRVAAALAKLDLQNDESLHVCRNGITLIGRLSRASLQTLDELSDVADHLPRLPEENSTDTVDGLSFDPEKLPSEFRHLEPLIRRYAVGDDVLRQELLDELSSAKRKKLLKSVSPLFPAINTYLDSFANDELPNEATFLGRLAEAAAEISVENKE